MTELTTTTTLTPFDGFDYDDGESRSGATYAKFDGAAINHWHTRGGALKNLGPYILANLFPELVRWSDKKIVDRILPETGKPMPDPDVLNSAIPVDEWEEDFNHEPKGPWVKNYTLHLVDPDTCAKLIVSNSTAGQRMAYGALKDATQLKRKFLGETVFPVVMLSEAQFSTNFGTKLRPHFEIKGWRCLGSAAQIAAPKDSVPALPGVEAPKVSAAEIIGDSIPDHPIKKPTKASKSAKKDPPWEDEIPNLDPDYQ